MKHEKSSFYIKEILKVLLDGEIYSTQEIAKNINLSEKATRNKIIAVQDFLRENSLGSIEKKPRVGVWLECDELSKKKLSQMIEGASDLVISNDTQGRVDEVLRILFRLMPRESITTQRLANELYLSAPTVLKVIRDCEEWLAHYHIEIVNERNRGFSLSYQENEYRIALKDFIVDKGKKDDIKKNIYYFFSNIDVDLINKAIVETENEWNYRFTDESFYEILIYCCLAYQRKDFSIPMSIKQEDIEILERYNEYPFTVAIFKRLHEKLHIMFSNEDILFLATQILCSKFMGIHQTDQAWNVIQKYDKKLLDFIDEMLETIGNILGKDFSNDIKLRESLVFHLRPTIFRLRYGSPQGNSLVGFIKKEYKNVFRATWAISILFEKHYGVQITEDELGFIVLYIQSALERKTQRYHAVLIADFTWGHAQLICERIRKTIPEIQDVEIVSRHDFRLYQYNDKDLIISSRSMDEKDKRIVEIGNLLSDDGMMRLRSFMDSLNLPLYENTNPFTPICYPLFSPELIFVNLQCNSKQEVLEYMCKKMETKGYVTNRFFKSVMEREEVTATSIGNFVALPHGAQIEVNEPHVAIAVLDKPVLWDGEEFVDIVFLLAFKLSTHEEIKRVQSFYKEYISLIATDEKIKIIRNTASEIELFKYLIQ